MIKKKRYPKIEPIYIKDSKGKVVEVMLDYKVYESIFERIADLKKDIAALAKKRKKIQLESM